MNRHPPAQFLPQPQPPWDVHMESQFVCKHCSRVACTNSDRADAACGMLANRQVAEEQTLGIGRNGHMGLTGHFEQQRLEWQMPHKCAPSRAPASRSCACTCVLTHSLKLLAVPGIALPTCGKCRAAWALTLGGTRAGGDARAQAASSKVVCIALQKASCAALTVNRGPWSTARGCTGVACSLPLRPTV